MPHESERLMGELALEVQRLRVENEGLRRKLAELEPKGEDSVLNENPA